MTIGEIQNLNDAELKMLNKLVVAELKTRRTANANKVKATLSIGQTVRVDHDKLAGMECTIKEIKRKRAVVKSPIGNYTVPMGMLIIE